MSKIKIAFVASTLELGGSERVMFELVTRLPSDRFDCELLLFRSPGPVGAELLAHGVIVSQGLQRHRLDVTALARLTSRFSGSTPDIFFALDHHNVIFWGGLASLFAGVPRRVIASHTTGRMGGKPSFRLSDRAIIGLSDAVIALSQRHSHYLQHVEGIDPALLVVIENGIDTAPYERALGDRASLGLDERAKVVIMVAALRPEKAHESLLLAAKRLAGTYSELRVLVAGDGPRRADLEALAGELGLGGVVEFLGRRSDVPQLLRASDVLVLPSHPAVETLPVSVLEAMAAGVPVVASAVGSVPDMIENGTNGILIPPADSGALEAAIRGIFENTGDTDRLVRNAARTVRERYTVERMVGSYAALFERLAG